MKKDVTICALGFLMMAVGCETVIIPSGEEEVDKVTFTVDPFLDGDQDSLTRTSLDGNTFLWAPGDTVGIDPDTGSQIYFELASSTSASSAVFDGGGWEFKSGSTYYSYYPFIGNIYLDRNHIPVSYLGQKQVGLESTSHIGPFDFMYTHGVTAVGGNLSFSFHHLNCIVIAKATLPAGTYTKMAITAPTECLVTKGYYDLMAEIPDIVGEKFGNQLVVDLEDITLTSTTTFWVYFMMAPVNLKDVEITVSALNSEKKEYQIKKTPSKSYQPSFTYGLTCDNFTEVPQSMGLIIDDWGDGGSIGGDAD